MATIVETARRRALTGPAVVAGAAASSLLAVATVDPNVPGSWPVCPSLSTFGVLCPLCGGLRSAHALTELDVAAAVASNVFVPLLVVVAAVGWVRWVHRSWTGRARPGARLPSVVPLLVALSALVYGVLRNLPAFEALAP